MMDLLAEPWTMGLASWTLFTIISAAVQFFTLVFATQIFSVILCVNAEQSPVEKCEHLERLRPSLGKNAPKDAPNQPSRLRIRGTSSMRLPSWGHRYRETVQAVGGELNKTIYP